jgi:hypothetical protein
MFADLDEAAEHAVGFLVACALVAVVVVNFLAGLIGALVAAPRRKYFLAAFLGLWVGIATTLAFGWSGVWLDSAEVLLLAPVPGALAAFLVAHWVGRPLPPAPP